MIVSELITELQQYDPNYEVVLLNPEDHHHYRVSEVSQPEDAEVIVLVIFLQRRRESNESRT